MTRYKLDGGGGAAADLDPDDVADDGAAGSGVALAGAINTRDAFVAARGRLLLAADYSQACCPAAALPLRCAML